MIAVSVTEDTRTAAEAVLTVLAECGRSESNIKGYRDVYDRFFAEIESSGCLSVPTESDCVAYVNRKAGSSISTLYEPTEKKAVHRLRRPLALLLAMMSEGRIDVTAAANLADWDCPACFAADYDAYIAWCSEKQNASATLKTKEAIVARFLDYLVEAGVCDLGAITKRDLSGFVIRHKGQKRKTVASIVSWLRDFLTWAADAGRAEQDLIATLPKTHVVRNESIPYLWSPEEVAAVLDAIDRSSAIGKRDYAMILLVARLGLRSIDLRLLEFSSIDWHARTLRITQHKTGLPLTLPLLDDVGWAIIDYMRNGRPETDCARIFVRHRWPFVELGDTGSLDSRLYKYAKRAGIGFPEGRLHGMHSFRSSLARAMVAAGTPLVTVSETLGHADTKTTQAYYLRLDPEDLRSCALDVEAVTGGAYA